MRLKLDAEARLRPESRPQPINRTLHLPFSFPLALLFGAPTIGSHPSSRTWVRERPPRKHSQTGALPHRERQAKTGLGPKWARVDLAWNHSTGIVSFGLFPIEAPSSLRLRIANRKMACDGRLFHHRRSHRSRQSDGTWSTFNGPVVISRTQTLGCYWTIAISVTRHVDRSFGSSCHQKFHSNYILSWLRSCPSHRRRDQYGIRLLRKGPRRQDLTWCLTTALLIDAVELRSRPCKGR